MTPRPDFKPDLHPRDRKGRWRHAMGFKPGDHLVPTRHFSVDDPGASLTPPGERGLERLLAGRKYRVTQIIGTNQLTIEHPAREGAELLVPTFDKTSVKRVPQSPGRPGVPPNSALEELSLTIAKKLPGNPSRAQIDAVVGREAALLDEPTRKALADHVAGRFEDISPGFIGIGRHELRTPQSPGRPKGEEVPIESIGVGDTVHFGEHPIYHSPPHDAKVTKITRHREEIGGVNNLTRVAHFDDGSTLPIASYDDGQEFPDGGFGQGEMTLRPSGQTERVTRGSRSAQSPGRPLDPAEQEIYRDYGTPESRAVMDRVLRAHPEGHIVGTARVATIHTPIGDLEIEQDTGGTWPPGLAHALDPSFPTADEQTAHSPGRPEADTTRQQAARYIADLESGGRGLDTAGWLQRIGWLRDHGYYSVPPDAHRARPWTDYLSTEGRELALAATPGIARSPGRPDDYRAQARTTFRGMADQALAFQDTKVVGGIDREELDAEIARRGGLGDTPPSSRAQFLDDWHNGRTGARSPGRPMPHNASLGTEYREAEHAYREAQHTGGNVQRARERLERARQAITVSLHQNALAHSPGRPAVPEPAGGISLRVGPQIVGPFSTWDQAAQALATTYRESPDAKVEAHGHSARSASHSILNAREQEELVRRTARLLTGVREAVFVEPPLVLGEAWSDEARKAALEARRRGGHGAVVDLVRRGDQPAQRVAHSISDRDARGLLKHLQEKEDPGDPHVRALKKSLRARLAPKEAPVPDMQTYLSSVVAQYRTAHAAHA